MTRLSSDIHEADRPIFCSSCFNSQPVRHVDFEAACDRGYGNSEAVQINLDDLVLCEGCLKTGAELLGMTDAAGLVAERETLEAKLDTAEKALRQSRNYANTLEEALTEQREDPIQIDHRRKPRKNLEEMIA